jgi:hypothetical protein
MEDVKPLVARIQALKSDDGGALTETQLMAFFLQCRVQPLQHRPSKLWSFFGLGDSSQVSDDLFEKKDLDKRVRALTTLMKEDEIPDLAASYFDSQHPLPAVCFTAFLFALFFSYHHLPCNARVIFFPGSSTSCFLPSSPRRGGHSKCAYFCGLRSPRG